MVSEQRKRHPTERDYVVDLEEGRGLARALAYAAGAIAGVALATVVVRGGVARSAARLRTLAERRMAPGRRHRGEVERQELLLLEGAVLDVFLAHPELSQEGLEIAAVAPGVIELTGVATSRNIARLAAQIAERIEGVRTVLLGIDVEDRFGNVGARASGSEWTGQRGGMGARRQARETDPSRTDDSRHRHEAAMERADRAQFEEEGYHHRPRMAARGYDPSAPAQFDEDELDNQSPYGKHATPREPGAEGPARSGVGEGLKPATELRLESADLPRKPHDGR
jgi:hypothetical protein